MYVDISDIAVNNHDYAVHLATKQGVLSYEKGLFLFDKSLNDSFTSIDLWRELCISTEILLKAVLLCHEIPFLKKRAHAEYGQRVYAKNNPWLQSHLDNLGIVYIAQINTSTVSVALKSAEKYLYPKIALEELKQKLISETFYIIIRTRRNRNTHFYFPNQAIFDEAEIEMLFLPLLNMLETIYKSKCLS